MISKLDQAKSGLKRFNGKLNILVRTTNKKPGTELPGVQKNVFPFYSLTIFAVPFSSSLSIFTE